MSVLESEIEATLRSASEAVERGTLAEVALIRALSIMDDVLRVMGQDSVKCALSIAVPWSERRMVYRAVEDVRQFVADNKRGAG